MNSTLLQKVISLIFLSVAILPAGCSHSSSSTPARSSIATREELLLAKEQIEIGGQNYKLEAYVWRDFMPGGYGSEGSDLIALVTVSEINTQEIPYNIAADLLWVIHGDEIWSTSFSDEMPPAPAYQLKKIARGGPKWSTGSEVVVVVKIADGLGGEYLLKAPNQSIQATN